MSTRKDILSLPAKAFVGCRAHYSLILATAKIADYAKLWFITGAFYVTYSADYYQFSRHDCRTKNFPKTKVLTVNKQTGNYCWRIPYSKGTYPK